MKKLTIAFIALLNCSLIFAQNELNNTFTVEENGYFINPHAIDNGFIATDNYANALYKISEDKVEKLLSAPGCGRYFTISPDKKYIGFKYINNGLQTPALFDLEVNKIIHLHKAVDRCGQVSFSDNGKIVFTVDSKIYVVSEAETEIFDIGNYSNIAPISPDGNSIVYSNSNDELILRNLKNKTNKKISENGRMSVYPQWSPDGKKILFQSDSLLVFDMDKNSIYSLGEGLAPHWSPNSQKIIFYKTTTKENIILNSDLYMSDFNGKNIKQLTHSEDIFEMQPSFTDENSIVYHTYSDKSIVIAGIYDKSAKNSKIIYQHQGILKIDFFNVSHNKTEIRIPGTVPYVHQVYDTPNDHYGYGSCAPTTSVMAFAYFNRLPKWPIQCNSPYAHTNNYGAYVSQKYTLNTYFYDDVAETSGGDDAYGGYGYMWGLGSPNSKMKDYTTAHYFNSVQFWTSSCTITKTRDEIDSNYPQSMCVMLTSSGHLILCKGYVVGQQTLIFSDPYGNKNTPGYPSYDGHDALYDWPGYNNGYQNLDYNGSYGYIAWTVTSQGNEVTYNDTIIDDLSYNHGFTMNNSQNGSHMRYFHDANSGYNSHLWFTYTMATLSDICWVTWEPKLPQTGLYEVFAYIPSVNANATGARYKITHANGDTLVIINQAGFNDAWASLGTYYFDTAMVSMVYLGDSTGTNSQAIAFDAMKWSYKSMPEADFFANNLNICAGDSVTFINNSTDATSYQWLFPGGSPAASTDTIPVVAYCNSGSYDVTLIANGVGGADTSLITSYINVNALPLADFSATDTLVSLPNALIAFLNNSTSAVSYLWNFGNGTTSTDDNPYCMYNAEGFYTVTLTALSNLCGNDSIIKENYIHVINSAGTDEFNNENFSVYPNPFNEKIVIQSENIKDVSVYNALGQLVFNNNACKNKTTIKTTDFKSGFYFLKIITKDGQTINLMLFKI